MAREKLREEVVAFANLRWDPVLPSRLIPYYVFQCPRLCDRTTCSSVSVSLRCTLERQLRSFDVQPNRHRRASLRLRLELR